jgi:hypothetical protein
MLGNGTQGDEGRIQGGAAGGMKQIGRQPVGATRLGQQ